MQILDYENLRDTIITQLKAVNTTTATYDLSSNLGARIKDVAYKLPTIEPLMVQNEYPYIFLNFTSKGEELTQYGNGKADRLVNIDGEITCIYDSLSPTDSINNTLRMVRNVEANLRNNLALNNYNYLGSKLLSIIPTNVNFNSNLGDESQYNYSAVINFTIAMLITDI